MVQIYFHRPDGYARRPRAPRRRREPIARHAEQPGQTSMAQLDRTVRRDAAMLHPCPACHAPKGTPCTRRPTIGETGRQPLGYVCHPQRHALAESTQDDDASAAS